MSPFHSSSSVRTYYEVHGDEESFPVVLIHPIGGNVLIWRHEIPLLTKSGFRVIAYELRGHYRTEIGKIKAFTMQDLANDLFLLLEHLKIKKCAIIGHSIGGIIGSIYASQHSEKVDALILINSSPKQFHYEDLEKHFENREIAVNSGIEALVEHLLNEFEARDLWKDKKHSAFFREIVGKTSIAGFVAATVALYSIPENLVQRLRAANCSVLTIVGSDDRVFMRLAKETKEEMPELELKVLYGSDHWEVIEKPKKMYDIMMDFLSRKVKK